MGGNDAEIQHFVRICYSNYGMYFCWTIYIIEGALLTFGAFLAWESRNVSNLTKTSSNLRGLRANLWCISYRDNIEMPSS